DEAVVTAENGWTWSFTGLDRYANGEEIVYSITEDAVEGYTSVVNGYDITNVIAQDYVTVEGTKSWNVPEDIEIPEKVEIQLFRDNSKTPIATTTANNDDWKYSFGELPKYAVDTDGHTYVYTVKEVPVEGFTAKYNGYDIINTYNRTATTEVLVEKVWNDFNTNVTTHSAITIELYQNGVLYDTANLGEDGNWTMTFADLPKYDANQKPFVYTIGEVPVNGYATSVDKDKEVENKFIITNTLLLGEPGVIVVEKQTTGDNKPADDVKFKFELLVQVVRPEGSNAMFDELALLSEMNLGEAASALNDAIDEVENTTELVTSGSQYAFYLTEKDNEFVSERNTLMAVEYKSEATTESAIVFEDGEGPVVTPEDATTGSAYEWLSDVTDDVVDAIMDLSNEYDADEIAELLYALAEELGLDKDEYSLALDNEAVRNLITAARVYSKLAGEQPDGLETTTPSALQVFQTLNGVTTQSVLYLVSSDDESDIYKVNFWLANGDMIKFGIQATSGSAISYRIVESLSDPQAAADYVGTNIFENGMLVTKGTSYGFVAYEENGQMGYLFQNNYENNPGGGTYVPPYTPPYVPPTDSEIVIEDPEVPLGDIEVPEEPVIEPGMEEELEDPEVPLGDAPATGDSANAVPFMALLAAAIGGLAITRRKFN
ncbi:MAG: Cna B-type domain-containing protein, partial [Peptococcaceae bacterium]|nr:Cna B-type domain-containing protein [Peptococcaceae bacterium]